ncbi:hypothetical protein CF335_g4604 [Tilletia laevis]|nr:hypothetical protein CF335_g4604 [Tilletia laevis]
MASTSASARPDLTLSSVTPSICDHSTLVAKAVMFPFPIRHRPHSTPPTLQNRQVWQPSGGLWGQAAFTPWRPSGTGATPSIHPAQEVHTAPDTASATASTNNDDGVTPFPVFRALPREVKETFHRIMEAMSTTTCDFLQTASPSQLPEDALQRIAVQAGTTIPHPLLPEGSDFGINEACPAAEGTATSVPNTVAPASSGMEPSHVDYAVIFHLSTVLDEWVRLFGPAGLFRHAPFGHILLGFCGSSPFHLRKGTVVADAYAARVGNVTTDAGELFALEPARSAVATAGTSSSELTSSDVELALPLDAFELADASGSSLTADAGVSGVDDRFRVGLDASGVPYPDIVALLRHGNQEST